VLERSSRRNVDFVVVGAGLVGCAVARELALADRRVVILEREGGEARGVSSRNSGVIHSGVFGKPGTRKQRSCIEGKHMLYRFAERMSVPHRRCGKLVIARNDEELAGLESRLAVARDAKIEIELLDPAGALAKEPSLEGAPLRGALWLPDAGIIDAHAFCSALLREATAAGAFFAPQAEVSSIEIQKSRAVVRSTRGPIDTLHVVNAAGLYADAVAAMVGIRRPVLPCRGDYFVLQSKRPYQHLIYPLSKSSDAGLGVHLTLTLDERLRLGPDTQWVTDKDDFSPAPHKREAFAQAARALLGPHIRDEDLSYDTCGIRPKRHSPVEDPVDFEVLATPRCIHLLGIESPGLTSAMSIGREVASYLNKVHPA
jgi:L-2-hydroxyglutarate oxidase LhgO